MKKYSIIILAVLFNTCLYSQQFFPVSWALNGGSSQWDEVSGIKTDASGNLIIAGSFYDTLRFGTSEIYVQGFSDMYTARFDNNGNVISVQNFGDAGSESISGFAVDSQDNLLFSGYYVSPPTFVDNYHFFRKYARTGQQLWNIPVRSTSIQPRHLAVDNLNNLYAAGIYYDTVTVDGHTLFLTGYSDAFLIKFTSAGAVEWIFSEGMEAHITFDAVAAVTPDNNILLAGVNDYSDQITHYTRLFINRISPAGQVLWQNEISGSSYMHLNSLTCEESGEFFITGRFDSTITVDNQTFYASTDNFFIAKFNQDGNLLWLKHMSYGLSADLQKSGTDPAGNVYAAGSYFIEAELPQLLLQKYTSDGELIWDYLAGSFSEGKDLVINSAGEAIFTGLFYDNLNIGSTSLTSMGEMDIFLFKIPAAQLNVSPQQLDFGAVIPGNSTSLNVNIFNPGETIVRITSLGISGSDSADFSLNTDTTSITLYPQQNFSVMVSFNPFSNGLKNAFLEVRSDAVTGPVMVGLTGIADRPLLQTSTDTLNFGSVAIHTEVIRPLTLYNTSAVDLTIYYIGISGPDTSFTVYNAPSVIAPFDSSVVNIGFHPSTTGFRSVLLAIESNSDISLTAVILEGEGVVPSLAKDSLNFQQLNVSDSASLVYRYYNMNSSEIILQDIYIRGVNGNEFRADYPLPLSLLPPSAYFDVRVVFKPQTAGKKSAFLVIESSSQFGPDTVLLKGSAVVPVNVSVTTGQNITVNAVPPGGYNFINNFLFYKPAGESGYQLKILTVSGTTYSASIPGESLTLRGLQYYLSFSDGESVVTYPAENPKTNPAFIQNKYQSLSLPVQLPVRTYNMVSIPLLADNPSLSNLLVSSLGPADPRIWRASEWNAADSLYSFYPELSTNITPGKAFWLINSQPGTLKIENARSLEPNDLFEIKLAPGWNQVGNPYVFPVSWPETDTRISLPVLWNADSLAYTFDHIHLLPWLGYWVYNGAADSLNVFISPQQADSSVLNNYAVFNKGEFLLKVNISGNSSARDAVYLGMLGQPDSRSSIYKPPAIDDNLSTGILSGSEVYAKQVKDISDEGEYWDIIINTGSRSEVNFNIEQIYPLPDNFGIWLLDLKRNVSIPLYKNYAKLNIPDGSGIYRIITGTESYASTAAGSISLMPAEFTLYQNYPNPFNPRTIIAYSLPVKGNVLLELYDALGRKLATLTNGELNPGIHEFELNMENYASGVYFYSIRFKENFTTKKLILLK